MVSTISKNSLMNLTSTNKCLPAIYRFGTLCPHLAGDSSTTGRFGLGEAVVEPRNGGFFEMSCCPQKNRKINIIYLYTYELYMEFIVKTCGIFVYICDQSILNSIVISKPIIEDLSVVDHPLEETPAS